MELDIFIKGELINLCIPTDDFILESNWYNWFNNSKTTRFLYQGAFPNTRADQLAFFEIEKKNKTRLILIISDKKKYIGTVSLSFIDFEKKTASVAIVIGEQSDNFSQSHLMALESICRITEHAFTTLGLKRIDSSQHVLLYRWQQRLELLGYKVEGIKKNAFIKGNEIDDIVMLGVTLDDYMEIKKIRGKYWDTSDLMKSRVDKLPKNSFYQMVNELIKIEGIKYYNNLFSL
jgi:RimJ/RimL family protein N-acetyltransferase